MGFQKGYTPWNKNQKHPESGSIISQKLKKYYSEHQRIIPQEVRVKISNTLKGNKCALGHRLSEETKRIIGLKAKGRIPWNKGTKGIMKAWNAGKPMLMMRGKNHPNWKGGCESEKLGKHLLEWSIWRKQVFERDNHGCKECGKSGVYIEPHHIIPKRIDKTKVFDITNGITLCRPCHIKTMGKEERFAVKYTALLVSQV